MSLKYLAGTIAPDADSICSLRTDAGSGLSGACRAHSSYIVPAPSEWSAPGAVCGRGRVCVWLNVVVVVVVVVVLCVCVRVCVCACVCVCTRACEHIALEGGMVTRHPTSFGHTMREPLDDSGATGSCYSCRRSHSPSRQPATVATHTQVVRSGRSITGPAGEALLMVAMARWPWRGDHGQVH